MKAPCKIGDRVRFALADVFLPGPEVGAAPSSEMTETVGTLIEFSDSGPKTKAFAVVEVVRRQLIVVPVEKLEYAASPGEDGKLTEV
jgi:hypothetical protein